MTRPPWKVFRKTSFNARIFARLAPSILFPSLTLTHFNPRRVTGGPSERRRADRGFPSPFLFYRVAVASGIDRPPRTGHVATGGDTATRRVGATTTVSRAFHEMTSRMPA